MNSIIKHHSLYLLPAAALLLAHPGLAQQPSTPDETVREIRLIQDDAQTPIVSKIYELKHVKATDIRPFVLNAVTRFDSQSRVERVNYISAKRQLLIVSTAAELIPYIDDLIEKFDRPGKPDASGSIIAGTGITRLSYTPKHRAAQDIVDIINGALRTGTGIAYLNQDTNTIYWGTSMTYQSGGAVMDETKIVLSMLAPDRFSLAYPDAAAHGSLAIGIIELTSTGDLVRSSPEFMFSKPSFPHDSDEIFFDVCNGGRSGRFVIAESHRRNSGNSASLHIGTYGPRPVGIVRKNLFGSSEIQFAGTFTFDTSKVKLQPGYMYYTDANGALYRGRPAGFAHREFGAFYVQTEDHNILSLHNQIGMAVSERELLIKLY